MIGIRMTLLTAKQEENRMDSDYVFLCGLMWCRFGQPDAGRELLRAADSRNPDVKALASAMLAEGVGRLKRLENGRNLLPARSLGGNYVDEIMGGL